VSVVKDAQSDFASDSSDDFQKETSEAVAEYAEDVDLLGIIGKVTNTVINAAPDAVGAGAGVIGLEEEAEACRDVTKFGATVGGIGGAAAGALFGFGLIPAALLGLAGAASGGATYGSACTAVTATDRAFRKKSDVYMGVYETEDGFSTWPLPASVWDDVIAPILGTSSAPKVGPGSIRPDVSVAMPVELERLEARQAERQAQADSSSALVAAGLAALVAYKLM